MILYGKTYASSKCELQIIGYVCVVGDGVVDTLIQQVLVAVKVLGNTQPKTEQLMYVLARWCVSLHLQYFKGHLQVSNKSYGRTARFPASTSSPP
jgi:hypothetical protein